MKNHKAKIIIGLVTFSLCLLLICLWMYWGINEAFYEGWYSTSLILNILLTLFQYLSVPIVLILLSTIAIYRKRAGLILFIIIALFALYFFHSNAGRILIATPAVLFALGFYFGQFNFKKKLLYVNLLLPLSIMLLLGIPQIIRVEGRVNDGNFGQREIAGLTWAAQGNGFPLDGTDWHTAVKSCEQLDNGPWRLPTQDEIARAAGNNPDKETPLWNPHSKVIYYWTSEEKDESQAFLVAYNGAVLARLKALGLNYQGYRCVK